MMVVKYLLAVIGLILFLSNVSASDQVNHQHQTQLQNLTSYQIQQLLLNTEQLRTNNVIKFKENLSDLEIIKNKFTSSQNCYYKYLKTYHDSLKGNYRKTISDLNTLAKECNDLKVKIRIHSLLANLYGISQEYKESISNLDFAVNNIDKISDTKTKILVYTAASIVYYLINQYDLSIQFSNLMIEMDVNDVALCKANVMKFNSLLKIEKKISFNESIPRVIENCHALGENIYAQVLNINWLNYRFKLASLDDEFKQIITEINQVNDAIDSLNYINLIGLKNSLLAKLYAKVSEPEKAVQYANYAINDSKTLGSTEQKIDALQVLIDFYHRQEDYKAANRFLIEKNQNEKHKYNDDQAKLMAYQTVKHDNLAKTHQIKALNNQNKVLLLEQKIDEREKSNQQIINILLAILLIVFVYLIYKSRKQHQKFKKLSELDHMTLIYNRKGIRDYMEYLLPYSEKKSEIIGYGIFDLDLFKKINDQYGHITGDWVIKKVIKVCRQLNNDKVTFARLGGEEFSIIMRDSSLDEIMDFSEQCRLAIEKIVSLDEIEFDIKITASFGITSTDISGYDYTKLMIHADSALYDSKRQGRNRVSI